MYPLCAGAKVDAITMQYFAHDVQEYLTGWRKSQAPKCTFSAHTTPYAYALHMLCILGRGGEGRRGDCFTVFTRRLVKPVKQSPRDMHLEAHVSPDDDCDWTPRSLPAPRTGKEYPQRIRAALCVTYPLTSPALYAMLPW